MNQKLSRDSICPACGLVMPVDQAASYEGYFHCSAECWGAFAEVLGYEYGHILAFSQVHSLTVDTYAVQHAGGRHKAKSVAVHLAGLYAFHEHHLPVRQIPPLQQRLAGH